MAKTRALDDLKIFRPAPRIRVGTDPTVRTLRAAAALLSAAAAMIAEREGLQ